MRILLIFSSILVLTLACDYYFCSDRKDGWYCCRGRSIYCKNEKEVYNEVCPQGCDTTWGYCAPAPWCELKSSGSYSKYCNITYLVDRQTDFTVDDIEAKNMVTNWINTTNATCSEDLYRMVACHQVYVPCDDPSMSACKKYAQEAAQCDDRISLDKCVWSSALRPILATLLILLVIARALL